MMRTIRVGDGGVCVIDDGPLGIEVQSKYGFLALQPREAELLARILRQAASRRRFANISAPPYVGPITHGQPRPYGLADRGIS